MKIKYNEKKHGHLLVDITDEQITTMVKSVRRKLIEEGLVEMTKKDFMLPSDKYPGQYVIQYEENWGPIVSKEQADEEWSRYKNSGLSFKDWVTEVA
jgi:hypothetical protein